MAPGDHGSTFAGSPFVCHVAKTTLDILSEPSFLEAVRSKGERLRQGLRAALQGNAHVLEVRGQGLINGIQLDVVRHALACVLYCRSVAAIWVQERRAQMAKAAQACVHAAVTMAEVCWCGRNCKMGGCHVMGALCTSPAGQGKGSRSLALVIKEAWCFLRSAQV